MHENELVEQIGGCEGDCGENIGAVGIAEADRANRREALLVGEHELRHCAAPQLQVVEVVHALRPAPEEPQGALLGNVASRRDDRGAGPYTLS